jgi:hypothetical protein
MDFNVKQSWSKHYVKIKNLVQMFYLENFMEFIQEYFLLFETKYIPVIYCIINYPKNAMAYNTKKKSLILFTNLQFE